MALNLHAMLCGSDLGATMTPGRYEAEEATLDHVALEALYSGFSGFGYAAAFSADEQSIAFEIDVPAAGPHRIDWAYSAAGGDAARSVRLKRRIRIGTFVSIDRRSGQLGRRHDHARALTR